MKGWADLHALDEDARIDTIGIRATAHPGEVVGVVVDDWPGKAERYEKKLIRRFPALEIMDRTKGPVEGVITIRVRVRPS